MNVLDLLANRGIFSKKVSSSKGGQHASPCPGCGGEDRFQVWPEQNEGGGSFWCRGCQKKGDAIQFLIEFEGLKFKEACDKLGIEKKQEVYSTPKFRKPSQAQFKPAVSQGPPPLWREKAGKLIEWVHTELMENSKQLDWLNRRGIDGELIKETKLGWNSGKDGKDLFRSRASWGIEGAKKLWLPRGLVIPCFDESGVCRLRIRTVSGEPRYYVIPGSSMEMLRFGVKKRALCIVESELDAIMLKGQAETVGVVALGAAQNKPDQKTHQVLKRSAHLLIALDFDEAGREAFKWWGSQYAQAIRWPVPDGKDPGEAYEQGVDLVSWLEIGLPVGLRRKKEKQNSGREEEKTSSEKKGGRAPDPFEGAGDLERLRIFYKRALANGSALYQCESQAEAESLAPKLRAFLPDHLNLSIIREKELNIHAVSSKF